MKKKQKQISKMLLIILIIMSTVSLVGCNRSSEEMQDTPFDSSCEIEEMQATPSDSPCEAVVILVGNTQNAKPLNLRSPLIQDSLNRIIRNEGFVAVVRVDGEPECVFAKDYHLNKQYQSASEAFLENYYKQQTSKLQKTLRAIKADKPQVDFHGALIQAVRIISALEGYDKRQIIVLGSGLNTTGYMSFLDTNLICADTDDFISDMKDRNAIPDFSVVDSVLFQNLGDVAMPQPELTLSQRKKLEDLYTALIEAGGSTCEINSMIPASSTQTTTSYPAVSVVDLPEEIPTPYDPEVSAREMDNSNTHVISLDERIVPFLPDSAEYRYPEEAEGVVKSLAEDLSDYSGQLLLCGCTAGDRNTEFGLNLSYQRAQRISLSLSSNGIDPKRMIIKGLGSTNPWHVTGAGYNGEKAASNRKVVVLLADSDMAARILRGDYDEKP